MLPPNTYRVDDFETIRQTIFDDAYNALSKRFPLENDKYRLVVEDLGYDNIPKYTKLQQKEAIQSDKTLSAKLRGRWVLYDKATGKAVSRSPRKTIMDVPYMTERGTFIRNGTEMTLPIQMRLVPGVYTRVADNGEARAHINVRPGTGSQLSITMNPANPVFKVTQGTRNYKLYPLLKHMGISDEYLISAWGKDIYKANYDDFISGGGWYSAKTAAEENPYNEITKRVFRGELDPLETETALGKPFKTVDPDMMVAAATKLLKVTRGEAEPDNRDSLENQRFFMAPDLISERVRLDAGKVGQTLLWKLSRSGDVNKIPAGALNKYINGLFTESRLAQAIEETNPLDAYMRATKVTRMGEGGISGVETAPMSARLVHNTYKGFIDPTVSPESLRAGLDSAIALNSVKGKDGFMYTPMINSISGKREYVNSLVASKSPVAFSEYRNSPQKYIPAMIGNKIEYMPKSQVKYFIPNGDSLFALSSNLIPLKSGIKAGRLLMAQKHQTQAVSLTNRMAPYVQTVHPGDEKISVESSIGKLMGAVFSKGDGKVISVTPDEMTVRYMDGTKETISLYNNHPLNRKTLISNEARVKPGDIVKKGQVLASSNYTDENGVSALGTQLRTAWLPFKGENYLDAVIVSEDAAKKLTSEHFYHTGVDKDSGTTIGKNAYVAAFPTKFNKDQLATIDKDGLVKPGTMVKFGDPLILSYTKRDATPGSLHRALVKDGVVKWEHEFPGYVTDVVNSSKGVKVYTKAYLPLQTGDKCFSEDTDLLTETGWKNIKDVTLDDKIATLNPETNVFEYLTPVALHKIPYVGYMYTIDTTQVNTCVTPYHNNFVQTRNSDHFELIKAENCFNRRISFKKDGIWDGKVVETFTFPGLPNVKGFEDPLTIDMASYLVLLGAYLFKNITPVKDRRILKYFNTNGKRIPSIVFTLTSLQQSLLIDFLNRGDIYKTVVTRSKDFADDIQRLCLHVGFTANIKHLSGGVYSVKVITNKLTPQINNGTAKVKQNFATYYNGYVYCPTMPKWNVVYTRRNGVPMWSGNCAARFANKGVTAKVVPTSEMPIAADGKPIDVIFGPTGIVSRVNSAQIVEAMLGKVAAKTGKRYVLPGFMDENMVEFAKRELANAGLTDREDVTDPTTGIVIPQVTVGNSYIVKMHHTAESKGGARATGSYTIDDQPGGSGHDSAKTLGNLVLGALIGHGCFVGSTNILTDRGYMEIGNIVKRRLPVNVYSYNKETDSFEYRPVTNWFVYTVDDSEMWEIHTTLNDTSIRCTKDHKFYTPDGLVKACELKESDSVYIGDLNDAGTGPAICIIKKSAPYIRPDYDTSLVYDITVEHNHNFIAAGVLVSNSTEILKDMKLVKGQKNTDFWRDFKLGRTPVMPSTPLIYEKFLASLQGAGINVHKEKNTTNIFALTNSDINDFAKAEVKNSDTYSSQNMQPMPGGLFDPNIFGPDGTQWGYIKLDEPLLNPIMEDPIKLILGLTEADLEAVISGNKKLPNGLTGGVGLKKQLESINMKQAVQDALNDIKTATKTRRDKAVKKYRYLQSMANHGVSPADFMLDKVPVIPPRFRRITQSGDLTMVADANYLYRALMNNQQDVRDARNIGLPDDIVGSGNLKVYKAFKAITGISDPEDRKLQEKQVSGLLKWVFGKGTPKAGAYQRNVVGGTLDVAGRNVITPNSALRLDEVGLPEKEAWTLYQDFVIRRLVQNGMDPLVATKEVTNRTKLAEDALKQVVNERPVLLTRAPALHKYSIMAFRPRLVKGETIQLSPPIEKPFNADFDGDSQVGRVIIRFKRNIDVPFKYRLDF